MKRPLNLSRNSRHSGSFPISAIPENKLEEEYRSRMKNDQELMTKEFDSIPTTTHAAMQHASKQECLSILEVRGKGQVVLGRSSSQLVPETSEDVFPDSDGTRTYKNQIAYLDWFSFFDQSW